MKISATKLLALFTLIFLFSQTSVAQKQSGVFTIDKVPQIELHVSREQWNTLLTNYDLNPKNEKKVAANFTFTLNGKSTTLDSIGLKLRGNTSRQRPEGNSGELHNATAPDWHHCHFGIDFDKNNPAQRFNGLSKLNLRWFHDDASYVREIYCYDLFRRFGVWTAPRGSYCRLTIKVDGDAKPAYYGIYAMVESIDEDFIAARASHWGSKSGHLWKGTNLGTAAPDFVSAASIGVEDIKLKASKSQYYAYDLKTDKDNLSAARSELTTFINDLNTKTGDDFKVWISEKMDVDLFLKTYAVSIITGMWDDYWIKAHNFYFYFASDGKAYFIPYDYDKTLGISSEIQNSGTQDPLKWGPDSGRPLINKILAIPEYQNKLKRDIKELTDAKNDYFAADKSMKRIASWQAMIAPFVANDTGEDMSITDIPPSWGNAPFYRLLSGNADGGTHGDANYFKSRIKSIPW